jgi:hypothetical protein
MGDALLNPQMDAAACLRLIKIVTSQRDNLDNILTSRLLDRDMYLQTISKRLALDAAIVEMKNQYSKEFSV